MPSFINNSSARRRAQLVVSDASVRRGDTLVLDRVDLTVSAASRIAIVGENGRGKSTLLQVLAGMLQPDSGTVQRIGTIGVAEQEMSADDSRTVGRVVDEAIAEPLAALAALEEAASDLAGGDEIAAEKYSSALHTAEALDAWDAQRRVHLALEALNAETERGRLLTELSVGQRYRVRLACLLGAADDFLLLDEPTNHLDREGLEFLAARLRDRDGGVVIVSHDRVLLNDVVDTVVDLDPTQDGRPRVYGNGFAGYRRARAAEIESWTQAYERQQSELARLQDNLSAAQNRLVSGWRPSKGHNKHGRATRAGGLVQSVHRRREELEAHAVTVPHPPQVLRFPQLSARSGSVLLAADRLGVAGRLAGPVSFELSRRDRLVVTGPNGAGKSTLLSAAAGQLTPDNGTVRSSYGTRLGFLRQETSLPEGSRASDVFRAHVDALLSAEVLNQSDMVGLSELGLLRPREASKRVGELSVGQQRRLDLALVLATRPHVLLLDEPTNHLSIALVDELTEAFHTTDAAVVVSTHDRQLLRDVSGWPTLDLTETQRRIGANVAA